MTMDCSRKGGVRTEGIEVLRGVALSDSHPLRRGRSQADLKYSGSLTNDKAYRP
jgi:hypothetical protein